MTLSIHTNFAALTTQSTLNKINKQLGSTQQRLSTGLRINSAADDAAGLAIATRLDAQSRGMGVAMRNVGDATAMLQTAESSFSEMTDIVQRMKDLATQATNDTNSADDRDALQAEFDELGKEVKNIMDNSTYAGAKLFNATGGKMLSDVRFQIGASSGETLTVSFSGNVSNTASALLSLSSQATSGAAAASSGTELTTSGGTSAAIENANKALAEIGKLRAQFGSNINRLNHINNNLANTKDNTDMARGNIMDTDFALDSANMTKKSMLMQSGISMLKQAGQMPGMIMSLLG